MEKTIHTYARKPGRTVKKKIMNAWEKLRVMEEEKAMGCALLGECWVKRFEESEQKRKERNKRRRDQKGGMMMVTVGRRSGKTRRLVSAEGRNSSIVVLFSSPLRRIPPLSLASLAEGRKLARWSLPFMRLSLGLLGFFGPFFRGKEITNNPCEGRFGSLALEIRLYRFAVL